MQLAAFAQKLATAIRVSQSDLPTLLVRYDLEQALTQALVTAEEQANQLVDSAWTATGASPYRAALLADVTRAYADARERLIADITVAYNAVSDAEPFVPGVTSPGTNPAEVTRRARATAVREAGIEFARKLALRNQLTVFTAGKGSASVSVLEEAELRRDAGEDVELEWVASMDGHDPRSCGWCKALHGTRVPVGTQFPHPEAIGKLRPPRLYLGTLNGPPLHPHCRCKVVVVGGEKPTSPSVPESAAPPDSGDFISSETIRNMPEEQYAKLHHFLRSALHELGQVIQRLMHPYD